MFVCSLCPFIYFIMHIILSCEAFHSRVIARASFVYCLVCKMFSNLIFVLFPAIAILWTPNVTQHVLRISWFRDVISGANDIRIIHTLPRVMIWLVWWWCKSEWKVYSSIAHSMTSNHHWCWQKIQANKKLWASWWK